mmetsp:Transcript_7385/g.22834  ORF Transcript_7385/g.22834 Transcript_7385/m.22834 type:complete len:100 (-) Transcript_7385:37-336(-)
MEHASAAPRWPEDARRPEHFTYCADPPLLPALLRYPREICVAGLRELLPLQRSCEVREGWRPHFEAACPLFPLLRARVVAAGLNSSDPVYYFYDKTNRI